MIVIKENKCVHDCRNYGLYEFNNTCLEKCPNGTIYNEFTNICNEEKDLESTIYTIYTTIFIKTD